VKKALVVFGTRPEAIKLVPVIIALRARPDKLRTIVCTTGQHRQMLDQVLEFFGVDPDHDMRVMVEDQNLFDLTAALLGGIRRILDREAPDLVVVQGDTTTSFVASLAAFYQRIPVAHVEAGLRTDQRFQPFPEEANRHLLSVLADYHFAPTEWARRNLLRENVAEDRIWVTGNTGIDALLRAADLLEGRPAEPAALRSPSEDASTGRRMVLVTGHRRESFGEGFARICRALRAIATRNPAVDIVYPVHLNPNVRKPVFEILRGNGNRGGPDNIQLIEPLDYAEFVALMQKSYLILTDSGGVQEEAPSLGKPVLVMRETTERPEGVDAGVAKLVGTAEDRIVEETQRLLDDREQYLAMARRENPYGDGTAADRIVGILLEAV
jgi:UDP-N-acetylglucosamine 2-epimerase (non-hydrolysing)